MAKPKPPAKNYLARAFNTGSDFAAALADRLRLDTWVDSIRGYGGIKDPTKFGRIRDFTRLTVYELEAMYHGEDLPAKIVDALPEEAFRPGFCTNSEELDKHLERWSAPQKLLQADVWGRLYGLGGIILGVDEKWGPPDTPLDVSQLGPGDLCSLEVVDGIDLAVGERYFNRSKASYGKVRTYRVNGTSEMSGQEIHETRLILFGGARTSERQRLMNQGRDLSVLQKPADILRDVEMSWRSVLNVLQDMSQAVFKIKGLVDMITEGHKNELQDRMEVVNMARSVARAVLVDSDSESFEHVGAQNITGIDGLLVRLFQRLAAAADMPLTILMGVSPAGLNATGESDLRIWYAQAAKHQKQITPQVRKLIRIIARTSTLDWDGTLEWGGLWSLTEKEEADLTKVRTDTYVAQIGAGMLHPEEATLLEYSDLPPEEILDLNSREQASVGVQSAQALAPDAPQDLQAPAAGSMWIDTDDNARLQVTASGALQGVQRVWFVDLDSPNPERQWQWTLANFMERARPAT